MSIKEMLVKILQKETSQIDEIGVYFRYTIKLPKCVVVFSDFKI